MINRDLPRVDIKGDVFIVDLNAGGLRNSEDPANILRFTDMIEQPGAVLKFFEQGEMPLKRFFYDATKKEIATIPDSCEKLPPGICYMEILTENLLDPAGELLKRGTDISGLPPEQLKSWFHLAHEIPHFSIDDERDFLVDTARGEIYQVSDSTNKIDFANVLPIRSMNLMCFTMDAKGRLLDRPIEEATMDDKIVFIPRLDQLDPIGFMRATGDFAALFKHAKTTEKMNRVVQPTAQKNGRKL
ncbi:MAG: hypothetical protein E6Q24_15040 [Chitinophagaceae bacterium]|nr:MAG: hypothetical protein E6Q24_15040 [Chitinophagaceae bacterium]